MGTDLNPSSAVRDLSAHALTLGSDGRLFGIGDHAIYTVGYDGNAAKLQDTPLSFNPYALTLAGDGNFYAPQGNGTDGYLHANRVTSTGLVVPVKYVTGVKQNMPSSAFSVGPDGNIYGAVMGSQPFIFQVNVKTSKLTKLYSFPADAQLVPSAQKVVVRVDGTIFGTVMSAPNIIQPVTAIYALSPSGQFSAFIGLYNQNNAIFNINADLALDGDHALIGVMNGGAHGDGEVFRISGL